MTAETATFISQLEPARPAGSDSATYGDDHLRLLKAVLQAQFPHLGSAAVTPTAVELNYVDGVTSNIQAQFDLKAPLASPAFTGTITGQNIDITGTLEVDGIATFGDYVTGVTATAGSNNTRLATTEFVQTAVTGATGGVSRGKMYFWGTF